MKAYYRKYANAIIPVLAVRSQLQQTEGRVARSHSSLIAQQNNLHDSLMTILHQILGRYIDPRLPN